MSKIIIIGPAYPLRGGLATFDERLAQQFISEGHEVIIYTFSLQYPNILFPGKTQYSDSEPPKDILIKVCINSINPINWLKVGRQIKNENADIVIARYWLPFMGPCLGTILRLIEKKNTKRIGLIDNALPHEKRLGDFWLTTYFAKALDGFITMSQYVKNDLALFTNKDVKLVHHPLYDNFGPKTNKNIARKILQVPEDNMVLLFFGFIRHYKGLDILIDALELLPKESNILLLVAGEYYAGENEIKEQIKHSSRKGMILEHTSFIKNEDVGLYFSASDFVIQPYRNATQSGVTPLAYHFEIPLIVTNVGALPDLVPPTLGYVCEPNPTSLAEAIEKTRSFDPKKFAEAIQVEKLKLSWSNFTNTIINI